MLISAYDHHQDATTYRVAGLAAPGLDGGQLLVVAGDGGLVVLLFLAAPLLQD